MRGEKGHYSVYQPSGQGPPYSWPCKAACTDPAVRAAEDSAKREMEESSQQHWRGGDKIEENAGGFGGRESAMLLIVSYP